MTISRIANLVLGLGLIAGLPVMTAANAQYGPPPPGMGGGSAADSINTKKYEADRELARLTKKYKLTDDEKKKIRPVLAEQQKMVAMLNEESLTDEEWVAGIRKAHAQTVAKVRLLMTDEHATKYVEDEAKQAKSDAESDSTGDGPPDGGPPGDGPPGGGPGGGGPPPGD
jgi:hypothetical protein